ncbi:hypothetical protein HDV00_008806 [Rhizophlyctis rosea]|nr:hypothetical protein HDV00_008806 [Rhizophlyctis rosea]
MTTLSYTASLLPSPITTINDDALVAILRCILLEGWNIHNLSHTCHRLHDILRNPTTVLAFLRSYPPFHAIAHLVKYPRWATAYNGAIFDQILTGPKPPFVYIEQFLIAAYGNDELVKPYHLLVAKCVDWHDIVWENIDDVVHFTVECTKSVTIFGGLPDHLEDDELDEALRIALEEELFPLRAYFAVGDCRRTSMYNSEEEILSHPRVKAVVKLWDILPRIERWIEKSTSPFHRNSFGWDYTLSLYKVASSYQKSIFEAHVQTLLATTRRYPIPHKSVFNLDEIAASIFDGQKDLSGWCLAVSILSKDPRTKYLVSDEMILDALDMADGRDLEGRDYLSTLEEAIESGQIAWSPDREYGEQWMRKNNGSEGTEDEYDESQRDGGYDSDDS